MTLDAIDSLGRVSETILHIMIVSAQRMITSVRAELPGVNKGNWVTWTRPELFIRNAWELLRQTDSLRYRWRSWGLLEVSIRRSTRAKLRVLRLGKLIGSSSRRSLLRMRQLLCLISSAFELFQKVSVLNDMRGADGDILK